MKKPRLVLASYVDKMGSLVFRRTSKWSSLKVELDQLLLVFHGLNFIPNLSTRTFQKNGTKLSGIYLIITESSNPRLLKKIRSKSHVANKKGGLNVNMTEIPKR